MYCETVLKIPLSEPPAPIHLPFLPSVPSGSIQMKEKDSADQKKKMER